MSFGNADTKIMIHSEWRKSCIVLYAEYEITIENNLKYKDS